MAAILLHPAVTADYKSAQALAERLGMAVTVETGRPARLIPAEALPRAKPSPFLPHGGDAA